MFAKTIRFYLKILMIPLAVTLSFPSGAETPHELLGVSPNATEQEIKTAYKNLAKIYHPNAPGGNADAEKFNQIKTAYDTLMGHSERALTSPENSLRQYMGKRMRQLKERSDFEPLHVFLSMFYDQGGQMISVGQVMAGLTPRSLPLAPTPEAEKIYLEYFEQMARPIWFLREHPDRLKVFVEDFYGHDMATAIVHFLMNVYEQAEIFPARASFFRTRFEIGGDAERKITHDLLGALRDMCTVNFDDCAATLLTEFNRHPELFSMLTHEAATEMIEMSDYVFRHRPPRWFFSTQYWLVFNTRKELMRKVGTANLQSECARLLFRHGRRGR